MAAIAVIAALTLVSLNAPLRYVFLMSEVLVAVLFATSLNLLMGYGGMLSLGHAAYYALGAYTAGILATSGWPMWAAMLLGPLVAAAGAALFGAFIVRTNHQEHAYFLMLTLAFSQLVYATIYKWYSLTRGDDGLTGIEPSGWLGSPRNFGLFIIAVVAISLWLLRAVVRSPFGLTLQAIRDNPERARFAGLPILRYQLAAFVIAGFFAGVAGVLYAYFSGTISPQIADWGHSTRPFIANTIGGIHHFWGPAIGVLILEVIEGQAARFTEHSLVAVGVLAIVVSLWMPRGVIGLFSREPGMVSPWARLFRKAQ